MGDSTKHGVKRKKKKKSSTRGHTRSGRKDGRTPSQPRSSCWIPSSTCPLRSHSAPGKFRRCPSHPNVTFSRLLECAGLFLTLLSTSSLSLHAAGCSLEWHFTSESLSHAGSPSPSGKSDLFFDRCLSVATPPLIAKPSGEKRSPRKTFGGFSEESHNRIIRPT